MHTHPFFTIESNFFGREYNRLKRGGDERGCRKERSADFIATRVANTALLSLSLAFSPRSSTRWELNLWMNEAKGERGLAHALYHNRNLLGLVTPACHNVARHRARLKRSQERFRADGRTDEWMKQRPIHRLRDRIPPPPRNQCFSYSNLFPCSRIANASSRHRGDRMLLFIGGGARPTLESWLVLFLNTAKVIQRSRADGKKREWTKGTRGPWRPTIADEIDATDAACRFSFPCFSSDWTRSARHSRCHVFACERGLLLRMYRRFLIRFLMIDHSRFLK